MAANNAMEIADIQKELKDMAVVITGGTRGIGAGIAKAFCTYGARVVIAGRDEAAGAEVAERLNRETAGSCTFLRCDVSSETEMADMMDAAAALLGRIDCMVNNAGYSPARRPVDEIALPELMDVMRVNVGGVFLGTKYALPYLRASRGSIINISSVLGHSGQEGAAIYAASKAAITAFSRSVACDEARNGVRVNVLSPGDIRSEIDSNQKPEDPRRIRNGPEGRIHWIDRKGEPEEIGMACLFLASGWAGFMTGSELSVDGGFFAGHGLKHPRFDWSGSVAVKPL